MEVGEIKCKMNLSKAETFRTSSGRSSIINWVEDAHKQVNRIRQHCAIHVVVAKDHQKVGAIPLCHKMASPLRNCDVGVGIEVAARCIKSNGLEQAKVT